MSPARLAHIPEMIPVLESHRIDEDVLRHYLETHVPGFSGPITVRQFLGGQSNPTYHIQTGDKAYVVRRKPPG